jgi:hypothetical protein
MLRTILGGLGELHKVQRTGDVALLIAPVDHGVQHAVLQQELAALEALG